LGTEFIQLNLLNLFMTPMKSWLMYRC